MPILRFLFVSCWLLWISSCGDDSDAAAPCPEPNGEFPPTHCAYIQGRLTVSGVPASGVGLRVDESLPSLGYAYTSEAATTDSFGRFDLVVFRVNQFVGPSANPDTARVFVKIFPDSAAARPGASADDSVSVLLTFAPMGAVVDTTRAELSLP
jgi:hypothetical protein